MQIDLDQLLGYRGRLQRALFSGTRRIRDQNGEEIEFRSVGEMQRALSTLESTITAAQSRPASQIKFQTSKGL
jgi:hypothetical protein